MKCNIRDLAQLSDQPCVIEGRLNYKKSSNGSYINQGVFKERWFRLINNYLFYFKISEMGKFDTKNPAGVFVMENSSIQMEHGQSMMFAFTISFLDEPERRHIFAARTEENVVQWVTKLRSCSYEYLRSRLHTLQSKIYSVTGKDPLLLVPRNDGARLWAPSVPFSTTPACTVSTSSFSCHLHTNGGFTLERSKSDVQAYANLRKEHQVNETGVRPHDTSFLQSRPNPFDLSIFDNRPAYSRAAPSPPMRKKNSPKQVRYAENAQSDSELFVEKSKAQATIGIMDNVSAPPRRKPSPNCLDIPNLHNTNRESSSNSSKRKNEEDLIKF